MSIILKGIDMPRKGTNIVLTLYGRDGTYDARTYPSGPRIKGEAIQIPKGHGDIKDVKPLRDEFSRTKSGYCGAWEFCDKPEDMQFLIDDEPTILESEEADEHAD